MNMLFGTRAFIRETQSAFGCSIAETEFFATRKLQRFDVDSPHVQQFSYLNLVGGKVVSL